STTLGNVHWTQASRCDESVPVLRHRSPQDQILLWFLASPYQRWSIRVQTRDRERNVILSRASRIPDRIRARTPFRSPLCLLKSPSTMHQAPPDPKSPEILDRRSP